MTPCAHAAPNRFLSERALLDAAIENVKSTLFQMQIGILQFGEAKLPPRRERERERKRKREKEKDISSLFSHSSRKLCIHYERIKVTRREKLVSH